MHACMIYIYSFLYMDDLLYLKIRINYNNIFSVLFHLYIYLLLFFLVDWKSSNFLIFITLVPLIP